MATMTDAPVAVIVFAKPPRPGRTKTRLAAALGDAAAARLARAFIIDTWSLVRSIEWADPILATTDVDDPFWSELPGVTVWAQQDGDLGDRMARVLCRALETHGAAMVIGSDVPGLPVAALDEARAALQSADVVIGPSEDGGFYLIGCHEPIAASAFAGVAWSTNRTRAAVVARLRSLGQVVVEGTPWFDVDEIDDLNRLRQIGEPLRRAAPETARELERLGAVAHPTSP